MAALAVSAAAAGAVAGFALGLPAAATGGLAPPPWLAAATVLAAAVADAAHRRRGAPAPWSVRRQVPREWARLLPLRVAALLYGARLGVGPLTVLGTWQWWAAAALAASAGPAWSALAGGVFGAVRVAVTVAVGIRASHAMSVRMAGVVRRERVVSPLATAALVAVAAALVLGACSGGSRPELVDEDGAEGSRAPPAGAERTVAASALDPVLAALLVEDAPRGFEPVDSPGTTGPLDLAAAVAAEPDRHAERSVLETRGFRRGFARAWRNADGAVRFVMVYEFETAAGARAYRRDGLVTLEGFGAEPFGVPGVPGARGFTQYEHDGGVEVAVHAVAFVRGARFFLVFVRSAGASVSDAVALAAQQDALA